MISPKKIALYGFLAGTVAIAAYLMLRTDSLEKSSIGELMSRGRGITLALNAYQSERPLKNRELDSFLKSIRRKYSGHALIGVFDKERRLLIADKNDALIPTNELYDAVIGEAAAGIINPDGKNPITVRYFNQRKFYLFISPVFEGRLLVVYPYQLGQGVKLRLGLEIVLIIIAFVIFFSWLYLYLQKSGKINEADTIRIIDTRKPPKQNAADDADIDLENVVVNSLHDYVYTSFMDIAARISPDTISLYVVKQRKNRLEKCYELKGTAFFRIDSSDFDFIDLHNDIGEELSNASVMVLENNSRIIIPLIHRGALLGTVAVFRQTGFTGSEINAAKSALREIARMLGEYILLKDVVIDQKSGLYTQTYFKLKNDELSRNFRALGQNFGVIVAVLHEETGDPRTLIVPDTAMSRAIGERMRESLTADALLFRGDDCLAAIVTVSDPGKIANLAEQVRKKLDRFKIKNEHGGSLIVQGAVGIAMASDGTDNLLERARSAIVGVASNT